MTYHELMWRAWIVVGRAVTELTAWMYREQAECFIRASAHRNAMDPRRLAEIDDSRLARIRGEQ